MIIGNILTLLRDLIVELNPLILKVIKMVEAKMFLNCTILKKIDINKHSSLLYKELGIPDETFKNLKN